MPLQLLFHVSVRLHIVMNIWFILFYVSCLVLNKNKARGHGQDSMIYHNLTPEYINMSLYLYVRGSLTGFSYLVDDLQWSVGDFIILFFHKIYLRYIVLMILQKQFEKCFERTGHFITWKGRRLSGKRGVINALTILLRPFSKKGKTSLAQPVVVPPLHPNEFKANNLFVDLFIRCA